MTSQRTLELSTLLSEIVEVAYQELVIDIPHGIHQGVNTHLRIASLVKIPSSQVEIKRKWKASFPQMTVLLSSRCQPL